MKKEDGVVTELGLIIDSNNVDFIKSCEKLDMGYLKGLENVLTLTYNDLCEMRKSIIKKMQDEEDLEESTELYFNLMGKMLSVEEKIFSLRTLCEQRIKNFS